MYKLFLIQKINNKIKKTEIESFENKPLIFDSEKNAENYFNNNFDVKLSEWNINYMYGAVEVEHYFKIVIKEC